MGIIKIAVLSDIHGNNVALEAAIEDAKSNNVDEYIVAGDLITDFPGTNEVIDIIKNLTPYVIKGNRENYLLSYDQNKNLPIWNTIQNSNIIYFYKALTAENLNYIRTLKDTMSLNFGDLKIKVAHGSQYCVSELVYFDNNELMDKMFKDLKEDILVLGHLHTKVRYVKRDKKIILNDGVIGMHNNNENKSQYAIIDYVDGKINITKRIVQYDIDKLKQQIKQSDILNSQNRTWTNLCYYCLKTGEDLRTIFCKEAAKLMEQKYSGVKQKGIEQNFKVIDDDIYLELSKKYEKYFLI